MPFFSRVFKSKDDTARKSKAPLTNCAPKKKPQWSDAWIRTRVDSEEVAELLHLCTSEIKSRGLDIPLLLLPFRPSSDPSAARTFVRNFFFPPSEREPLTGRALANELRMQEVMVLISVMKWCWARLPGGVVSWETYDMFKVGEKDSGMARDAFTNFIPISVDANARVQIITDFFELIAAVAAHGKTNGLGGHKLSRFAGWWAFGHIDTGKGFDAGYRSWESAADATSHLFFAYLRSIFPEPGRNNGILSLPRSLQQLLDSSEYPPGRGFISNDTTKVVMIVDVVSPTPYALLRRAKNFEYRDSDRALQEFANSEDPVQALTDECRRVLNAISSTNQSHVSNAKTSTSLADPSWSRFEDIGFSSTIDENDGDQGMFGRKSPNSQGLSPSIGGYNDLARPTTPSWADFLNSGFVDEHGNKTPSPILVSPDQKLPPLNTTPRGPSSQSHRRNLDTQPNLEPGELASITSIDVDDAFWWVWISSLAGEEPTSRKAVFGRCAFIETHLSEGRWMVMEEQVKGAAPAPPSGAYVAEKKRSFFGFTTKRGRLTRRRSGTKKEPVGTDDGFDPSHRATLAPDQSARIHQAAADITAKKKAEQDAVTKRNRTEENIPQSNRNSVFTLGPQIKEDMSPALQWARQYDKQEIRAKYLGDSLAGKGSKEMLTLPSNGINRSTSTLSSTGRDHKELPPPPRTDSTQRLPKNDSQHQMPESESQQQPSENGSQQRLPVDAGPAPTATAANPPVTVVEPAPAPPEPAPMVESNIPVEAASIPILEESLSQPAAQRPPSAPRPPSAGRNKLQKSVDGGRPSPEQKKVGRLPGPPPVKQSGIRRLFGTKKSRETTTASKAPTSPVETNPAILAARRALEGKSGPQNHGTGSPPLSPGHFQKNRNAKSPIAAVQTVAESPSRGFVTPPQHRATTPDTEPESAQPTQSEELHPGPPRTQRDDEYDQLSRVDTNEREHADAEFSTFDQGPLVDQPGFAPQDSPVKQSYHDEDPKPTHGTNHLLTYSAVTAPAEASEEASDEHEEEEDDTLTKQVSPTDRWAQIRKNAAERATRQAEEPGNRSRTETRTDDGETSGEETIESRVARIKARVAELTGNMEQPRR